MMTPKKKPSGKGVMIPRKTKMAKGGTVKKATGGGVMIPRKARGMK